MNPEPWESSQDVAAPAPAPPGGAARPSATIEYGNAGSDLRRRRQRRILILLALAVVAGGATYLGFRVAGHWRLLYAQWRATGYEPPADTVIQTGTLTKFDGRSQDGSSTSYQNHGSPPERWRAFVDRAGGPLRPPVYVGERRTPSGKRRLVLVSIAGSFSHGSTPFSPGKTTGLVVDVFEPATPTGGPQRLAGGGNPGVGVATALPKTFRLFAGRADPADASRVNFIYEADGVRSVVECQLLDDDTVAVQVKSGPAVTVPIWSI